MTELRTVVDGLCFPEGPRWHDGHLWYSDMHAGEVRRCRPDGSGDEMVVQLGEDHSSGLGWDGDDRLLIVAMAGRRLLRLEADGSLTQVADLSGVAAFHCNDMVVDHAGRAYIGNFGFDYLAGQPPAGAALARVDPDGRVTAVAEDLMFPNGAVITADGSTLVVGETFAGRLSAYDVAADGSLSGRRVWAQLPQGVVPDGICLDADGAVWAASPTSNEVVRVAEGGEILERIATGRAAFACMLGGGDGRTLFVCTADGSDPVATVQSRTGRIEAVLVGSPHAGRP